MSINIENAKQVYEKVKELEKQYQSQDDRTLEDIEKCYTDEDILSIWKFEQENDGWDTFENFLIDFIEQNLQFE